MTTTQVRYWELREAQRHNRATEGLTASQLTEAKRHNVVSEKQEDLRILETKRHNLETEYLTASEITEKIRHNQATELLTASDIRERTRHNLATEAEARRHNMAQEDIGHAQLRLDKEKLINEIERTDETVRHNKVVEAVDKAYKEAQTALVNANTEKAYQDIEWRFVDTLVAMLGGVGNVAKGYAAVVAA